MFALRAALSIHWRGKKGRKEEREERTESEYKGNQFPAGTFVKDPPPPKQSCLLSFAFAFNTHTHTHTD